MDILVIGAGIGGLSTALVLAKAGHNVTILDACHKLAEVGAGVQLTPNTTKWLSRWGVLDDVLAISALPESFNVTNGISGQKLGSIDFGDFPERYGGPYLVIHRADIHRILHEHAVNAGASVRLNSRVQRYIPDAGAIVLSNGERMDADLVVAVDGINSHARSFLGDDIPTGTLGNGLDRSGFAAYRLIADVQHLTDSGNEDIATSHRCNCIINGQNSIMTYKVKGTNKLNLVLSHPDNVDATNWTQEEFRKEIHELYKDFDPKIRKLLETAIRDHDQKITNWPIHMVPNLPRWHTKRLILLGDAAHAMPFYLSMGVSMAAEDAAGLARCLDLMAASAGSVGLEEALQVVESVRKMRAQLVRDASLQAGRVLHFSEGHMREARDQALGDNGGPSAFKKCMSFEEISNFVMNYRYGIIDNTVRDWCYAYDVVEDIDNLWQERFKMNERRT